MNPYSSNYISLPYSNTERYSPLKQNYYSSYPTELSNIFRQNNSLVNSMLNNRLSKFENKQSLWLWNKKIFDKTY